MPNAIIKELESVNYTHAIQPGMAYNIGESVLVVPVWKEWFCDLLIEVADQLDYEALDADMGEYGAAPGQEARVAEWSPWLLGMWKRHVTTHLFPAVGNFYRAHYAFKKDYDIFRSPFIIKYDMDGQTTLDEHHDTSLLTFNMTFSKRDRDYTGSDVVFPRQNWTNYDIPQGWAAVFPGPLTHPHFTNPITSGKRYGWVSWIRGGDLKNVDP
jgi:hypothetical protein